MVYDKKVTGKNILCLESHWGGSFKEPKLTVKPILDYITIARGNRYAYHLGYTREELTQFLSDIPARDYNLLFMAFHGRPGKITFGMDYKNRLSFNELADIMGTRFHGYGIHFASCSVLKDNEKDVRDFMEKTQVAFVSGYGQGVDYIEGALMDTAFLGKWIWYKSASMAFKNIKQAYKDFIKENKFIWYLQ